jgi:AhpD family alkylhydroperoxidase
MRIAPACNRPWYLRPFFWNQLRKYGRVLDAALLWARSPRLFLAVATLYGAIDRRSSPIPPALRSLVTVRVSQINRCRFCVDVNAATLLQRGIGEDKLWALEDWRASNLFDERERIALEYAEAITRSDLEVTDDLMARLKRQFDGDAIVELTALIAFQNLSSKFNAALDVPPQGFCRLPGPEAAERASAVFVDPKRPDGEQGGKDGS